MTEPQAEEESTSSGPYDYELFGLRVRSDIPLPELFPAARSSIPDVQIRTGTFPPADGERAGNFAVTEAGSVLNVAGAGRYLIRNGSEILVEPADPGSLRHLRLYLLGSAFGAILHQRRLLPLHANSIEIGGKAAAFLGHSGAGKSTMAAWFHDRGFTILADDVCVVTEEHGRPIAHPGIPRLRMWRDALEASGRSAEAYELSFDDADKYNVPTRATEAPKPIELGAIYLLKIAEEGVNLPLIEPLQGIAAVDALVANTYRGSYIPMLGGTQEHLKSCLALVRSVPMFAVNRAWGREHLERQFAELEAHARETIRRPLR